MAKIVEGDLRLERLPDDRPGDIPDFSA